MRDQRGGPNRRMRLLALVLALLLAGPLTALLVQGAVRGAAAAYWPPPLTPGRAAPGDRVADPAGHRGPSAQNGARCTPR